MNMDFKRKLPTPKEVKEMFPLPSELAKIKLRAYQTKKKAEAEKEGK